MQKRIQFIIAGAIVLLCGAVVTQSCNKLDTTDIGTELIPAVDNVNTFADTLTINATQGIFNDTTVILRTDDHALGIMSDPLFGQTKAGVYFELKPSFYPYYIGNAGDTINPALVAGTKFDSVVLVMNYKGFYGDSMTPIHLQVSQVSAGNPKWDSTYAVRNVNYAPNTTGAILGTATIDVRTLATYFRYTNLRDTANNQIRIKLSTAFMNSLTGQDTSLNYSTNAFRSDSLFKNYFRGFAVTATSGNGLMYTNLADTNTKLEIHYVRKDKTTGALDTAYSSFKLNSNSLGTVDNAPSITVNNIVRNRGGYPVSSPSSDAIYIQTAPGTYANLSIPGLTGLSNRIIHRAEITIEQVPDNPVTDGYFPGPPYMYLDLIDTTATPRWKPIYYDLNNAVAYDPDYTTSTIYFPTGGVNHVYFGGFLRYKTNTSGITNAYYTFNITRYVQQIATKHTKNYNLRLSAPYDIIYPQYVNTTIPYTNPVANGRIKVGSGTNANYKMRLRLVYSKI